MTPRIKEINAPNTDTHTKEKEKMQQKAKEQFIF